MKTKLGKHEMDEYAKLLRRAENNGGKMLSIVLKLHYLINNAPYAENQLMALLRISNVSKFFSKCDTIQLVTKTIDVAMWERFWIISDEANEVIQTLKDCHSTLEVYIQEYQYDNGA